MDKPEAGSVSGGEVLVWDAVVRLFHWIVVTGCVLDLFVLDDGKAAHRFIGYVVAGALMVRFLLGLSRSRARALCGFRSLDYDTEAVSKGSSAGRRAEIHWAQSSRRRGDADAYGTSRGRFDNGMDAHARRLFWR